MSDKASKDNHARKLVKRTPEAEVAIGARVKAMRIAAGMTQTALGEAIGVTFQQIQKYEKGKDRVAVSTLQVLAAALGVPPAAFFDEEMPSPTGDISDVRSALKGAAGLQKIPNPKVRKHIAELIGMLGGGPEPVDEGDP